ncbi:molybdopterin-dependent oxidoreductase [bacterium]|nr:molybdopterin-dependent oxidoreductase [bacterium]
MKSILSTCGGCGTGCGIYLYAEDGRIKGVSPVRDHPSSGGGLCLKGWNIHQSVNSSERLKKPLIKVDGKFKEVEWKEAINFAVEGFKKIRDKASGNSIGVIGSQNTTNEECYTLMKFARSVLGTNNIDQCGFFSCISLQNAPFGVFYDESMYNSIDSLGESDVAVLVGANVADDNPQIGARILRAIKRGVKLFIIGPRDIQYGKYAASKLRNISGSEVSVINGLLRLVIGDKEGKEESELYESLSQFGQEYIEGVSKIDYDGLEELAELLNKPVKKLIFTSSGLAQNEFLYNIINSLLCIAKHTNARIYSLGGQNNFRGAVEMGVQPGCLTDYQPISDTVVKGKFEKAWGCSISGDEGLNVYFMLEEALKNNLKGMYVVGENPVVSIPDTNYTKRALGNLEFLVVQDLFMTETANLADVVLPASSYAEKDGTFTNLEGKVQRVRKALDSRFESKTDLEIIGLLAEGMGSKLSSLAPEDIMKEIASLSPHYKGVSYKKLDEDFGLYVGFPLDDSVPQTHSVETKNLETAESPDDEFPFHLIAEKVAYCHNSGTMSKYSSILKRELPRGEIQMNSHEARKLEVRTGYIVRIISRRGELTLPVKVNPNVLDGTVFIPLYYKSGNANVLTGSKLDINLKLAGCKSCAVRVEKV